MSSAWPLSIPRNLSWRDTPDTTAFLATSGIVIFAFMGIESGLGPSGEVRDPWRTVPRASFLALVAVSPAVSRGAGVAQGILGSAWVHDGLRRLRPPPDAAVGDAGRIVMLVGAAVSMLGLLFGAGLVNPRIVFALARDGFLPRSIAERASDVSDAAPGILVARSWSSGSRSPERSSAC